MSPILNPMGRRIKEHWKEFRPKAYRELVKSGKVNHFFNNQENRAIELLDSLKGLDPYQRLEIVREQFFPPSEDDQPELGGPFSWEQED